MRRIQIIVVLYLCTLNAIAQDNWQRISDISGIEFSMPKTPLYKDTLSTAMYSNQIDSTEALLVHIYRSVDFDTSEDLFNSALTQENGDTLRAIAKLTLLATDGELISINEVYTNNIRGIILGIRYHSRMNMDQNISYIKYYIKNNNFIAFTWTGGARTQPKKIPRQGVPVAPTAPTYKDVFFESVTNSVLNISLII